MIVSYQEESYTISDTKGLRKPVKVIFYLKGITEKYLLKEFPITESTTCRGNEKSLVLESFKSDNFIKQCFYSTLEYMLKSTGFNVDVVDRLVFKLIPNTYSVDLAVSVVLYLPVKNKETVFSTMILFDHVLKRLIFEYFTNNTVPVISMSSNVDGITISFDTGDSHVEQLVVLDSIPYLLGDSFILDVSHPPTEFINFKPVRKIEVKPKKKFKIIIRDLPSQVKTTKTNTTNSTSKKKCKKKK